LKNKASENKHEIKSILETKSIIQKTFEIVMLLCVYMYKFLKFYVGLV